MSNYVLVVSSESLAPTNMPNFITNLENETLTSFEIIGKLYEHGAIYVRPKASQLGILRSVVAMSSIEMVLFAPEDQVISTTYLTETSGLPRIDNIADIEANYAPESARVDDVEKAHAQASDQEDGQATPDGELFRQGG